MTSSHDPRNYTHCLYFVVDTHRALFQYTISRLIARSRTVSKPWDFCLGSCARSEIWQVPLQQCCRGGSLISKRYDHLNCQYRGFATSWDFMIRRLIRYWDGAQNILPMQFNNTSMIFAKVCQWNSANQDRQIPLVTSCKPFTCLWCSALFHWHAFAKINKTDHEITAKQSGPICDKIIAIHKTVYAVHVMFLCEICYIRQLVIL